jgi:hypothetical protein
LVIYKFGQIWSLFQAWCENNCENYKTTPVRKVKKYNSRQGGQGLGDAACIHYIHSIPGGQELGDAPGQRAPPGR